MQLWRKYFFVAHGLFALIFAISLMIFISGNFKNELHHMADLSRIERDTLINTLEKWYRMKAEPLDIIDYCQQYAVNDIFLEVKEDGQVLVDTIDKKIRGEQALSQPIHKSNGKEYLTLQDSFKNYQGRRSPCSTQKISIQSTNTIISEFFKESPYSAYVILSSHCFCIR